MKQVPKLFYQLQNSGTKRKKEDIINGINNKEVMSANQVIIKIINFDNYMGNYINNWTHDLAYNASYTNQKLSSLEVKNPNKKSLKGLFL